MIQLFLLIGISIAKLDINSVDCKIYLSKFGPINNDLNSGITKIGLTGNVAFTTNNGDVQVNLRYSDSDYYDDPNYFGLVEQDGKAPEETCLDLKLMKYPSKTYANPQEITELKITSSFESSNKFRYYTFIIPHSQFSQYLIEGGNSKEVIYTGYYALQFFASSTGKLQYSYYFEFSITISKLTANIIDTSFQTQTQTSQIDCKAGEVCVMQAQTQIKFCTDLQCNEFFVPDLHLNDQFVLIMQITTPEMDEYYFSEVYATYVGNGLSKRANIISIDNTVRGRVILSLKAEIAWRNITIRINGLISNNLINRRFLSYSNNEVTINGESYEIECIKPRGQQTCATCEQEKILNGFNRSECSFSQVIFHLMFLFILIL